MDPDGFRLPSYEEAIALVLLLDAEARERAAVARALKNMPDAKATAAANEKLAAQYARAAELLEWMAERATRLSELTRPAPLFRKRSRR